MKHTVTIEPLFRYAEGLLSATGLEKEIIVQGETFKLGLKICNIGDKPTQPFTIKDIKIKSASGDDIIHVFAKEYEVGVLNPNKEQVYWISNFGTDMFGLADISLNITPRTGDEIEAHQISRFNSEELGHNSNQWVDFFYIRSSNEHTQRRTNILLIFLTLLMVFATLFPMYRDYTEWKNTSSIIEYCKENETGSVSNRRTGESVGCDEYLKIRSDF